MRTILVAVAIAVAVLGCRNNQAPTGTSQTGSTAPEKSSLDPSTAASLKSEIADVRSQIAAAEAESDRYSGRLVKALIDSRVQTFKQTLAMLEQRDKAFTFGLRLSYTIDGKPFQLPAGAKDELAQVEQEIRDKDEKIRQQGQEVPRYSGGLVQSLSLSTLATMKQTQAMLNQRRLAIKYELPQYLAFQTARSTPAPTTQATVVPSSLPSASTSQQAAAADDWEIVEVASRPGESNSSWTRFAWKLTLRNKASVPQRFDATIEFP